MDKCSATIIGMVSLTDVKSQLSLHWAPDKQASADNALLDQLLYEELRMMLDTIRIIDPHSLVKPAYLFADWMPFKDQSHTFLVFVAEDREIS